jgi:hypothetical protein
VRAPARTARRLSYGRQEKVSNSKQPLNQPCVSGFEILTSFLDYILILQLHLSNSQFENTIE